MTARMTAQHLMLTLTDTGHLIYLLPQWIETRLGARYLLHKSHSTATIQISKPFFILNYNHASFKLSDFCFCSTFNFLTVIEIWDNNQTRHLNNKFTSSKIHKNIILLCCGLWCDRNSWRVVTHVNVTCNTLQRFGRRMSIFWKFLHVELFNCYG